MRKKSGHELGEAGKVIVHFATALYLSGLTAILVLAFYNEKALIVKDDVMLYEILLLVVLAFFQGEFCLEQLRKFLHYRLR